MALIWCDLDLDLTNTYKKFKKRKRYKKLASLLEYNPLNREFPPKNINYEALTGKTGLTEANIKEFIGVLTDKLHKIKEQQRKFGESLFSVLNKFILFWFGIYLFYEYPWIFTNTKALEGYPNEQNLKYAFDLKLYYIIYFGYYVFRTISSTFFEKKLNDFVPLFIHHLATIFLIVYSYHCGFLRIGIQTLLIHEPADLALQTSKCIAYISKNPYIRIGLFIWIFIVWISTRLILFPYICIIPGYNHTINGGNNHVSSGILTGFLLILWCLHLYWFWLLIKAALNTIGKGKTFDDIRDDDVKTNKSKKD